MHEATRATAEDAAEDAREARAEQERLAADAEALAASAASAAAAAAWTRPSEVRSCPGSPVSSAPAVLPWVWP